MLVLSRRPPSPVARTAASTFSSANQLKAMPVVISKKDSPVRAWPWRKSQTYSLEGIRKIPPYTVFILSRKSVRCGEVYSPTFIPPADRAAASMELTEPLPLVPATWMQG